MHRSGTSLIARWLNLCGLNMGDRLLGIKPGNPYGHFEDLDFLNFHIDLMSSNGLDFDVELENDIVINDYFFARARSLAWMKNSLRKQWAMKDPRTCLFIKLWNEILPNAYWLILFRPCHEVVNSLIERDIKLQVQNCSLIKSKWRTAIFRMGIKEKIIHYSKVWLYYNRQILQNIDSIPKNHVLFTSLNDISKGYLSILSRLQNDMGFSLNEIDIGSLVDSKLYKSEGFKQSLPNYLIEEIDSVGNELLNKTYER